MMKQIENTKHSPKSISLVMSRVVTVLIITYRSYNWQYKDKKKVALKKVDTG